MHATATRIVTGRVATARNATARIAVAVAVTVAVLGALVPSAAATGAAAAPLTGKTYVALGDSFTADWGVDPVATATQPSTGCRQSLNDYPHQVAANLGLALTDVSCAGALTTNMTQPQTTFPDEQSHPAAKPQFDALTTATDVVTIGIGGNDFGFADIAAACAVNPLTGYVFGNGWSTWYTTCRSYYDPTGGPADDSLRARILDVVGPAVQKTVAAIRTHSPRAAVFFVDYLALSPDRAHAPDPASYPASCYSSLAYSQAFPFGGVDTEYLASLQQLFSQTVSAAAAQSGATVVSPYASSLEHTPCAGTSDPWVNGITVNLTTTPAATAPTPTASRLGSSGVQVGSLHPNLEGAVRQSEAVTFAILQTLTGEPAPPTTTTPTTTTTPPTTPPTTAPTTAPTSTTPPASSTSSPSEATSGSAGSAGTTSGPPAGSAPPTWGAGGASPPGSSVDPVAGNHPAGSALRSTPSLAATGATPFPLVIGLVTVAAGGVLLLLARVRRRG